MSSFYVNFQVSKHISVHRPFSGVHGAQASYSTVFSELWGIKYRMVLITYYFLSTGEAMTYLQTLQNTEALS